MTSLISHRAGGSAELGFEGDTEAERMEKKKVWERHQKRKERQAGRHILTHEMLRHEIPRLFVCGRADGTANGFHCRVCRKDISMLSHGEAEIYRHFLAKCHYKLDRRYRFAHEDAIYTRSQDRVAVSDINDDLRQEILSVGVIELGPSYPLVGDKLVVAPVLPKVVPLDTLMNCLLELLRFGGSHSLFRRLWGQLKGNLHKEGQLRDASWTRAETLVSCDFFCLRCLVWVGGFHNCFGVVQCILFCFCYFRLSLVVFCTPEFFAVWCPRY